jgi:hypothetical protein
MKHRIVEMKSGEFIIQYLDNKNNWDSVTRYCPLIATWRPLVFITYEDAVERLDEIREAKQREIDSKTIVKVFDEVET